MLPLFSAEFITVGRFFFMNLPRVPFACSWGTHEQRELFCQCEDAYEMDGFIHQCGRVPIPIYSKPCARCIHLPYSEELRLLHPLLPRKLFTLESWAKKQNKNLYLREKRRVNGPSHTNFFSHKLVHSSLYSLRICNSEGIKPRRMHAHNIQFWYKAGFCAVSLPWNTEKMIKEKL